MVKDRVSGRVRLVWGRVDCKPIEAGHDARSTLWYSGGMDDKHVRVNVLIKTTVTVF